MKTYQEAVFQLALVEASAKLHEGVRSDAAGRSTVAFIYGVQERELGKAITLVFKDALAQMIKFKALK